jgi:tripartite-type tricarboxylate transporter receptor subunit TctC
MTSTLTRRAQDRSFRRPLLAALALLLAGSALMPARAQSAYPDKPIRVVIPLAAGSAVDNAARILLQKMGSNLGQSFVIENQPGAAGLIGAGVVAKAAPDGYTLGAFNDSIMTMVPNLKSPMPWDIMKDFAPISLVATVEWGLVAAAGDTGLARPADLIAAAKAAPGAINYGSGGNGSPQHIAAALFAAQAGIQMQHVPYKGATQAAIGVAAGEVRVAFQGLATVTGLIGSGKLKLLAVGTPQRHPRFPDAPTVAEAGLPGFEFNSWFTLMAPAGTPPAIVNRLQAEVAKALADPEVKGRFDALGLTPRGSTREQLAAATREQFARYQRLIRSAGISGD